MTIGGGALSLGTQSDHVYDWLIIWDAPPLAFEKK